MVLEGRGGLAHVRHVDRAEFLDDVLLFPRRTCVGNGPRSAAGRAETSASVSVLGGDGRRDQDVWDLQFITTFHTRLIAGFSNLNGSFRHLTYPDNDLIVRLYFNLL